MASCPRVDVSCGGRESERFEEATAVVPGAGVFLNESFEVVEFRHGQSHQGDTGGGEEEVHKHVPLFDLGSVVAGIIQLNAEHRHPVLVPANEEIDVLLADHLKGTIDLFMLEDISQPGLDLDAAAFLGDLKQTAMKPGLRGSEEGFGRVSVGHGHTHFRIRGNELHWAAVKI